jgi:hypothetical protein
MSGPLQTELRVPVGHESITVSSTALGFTLATAFPDGLPGADMAVVTVETDAIRHWSDGTAPTATVGHKQAADSSYVVYGQACLRQHLMIRVTNDATVRVSYYRRGV